MSVDYKSSARCFINGQYVEETERGFTLSNPANGKVVLEKVQEAGPKGKRRSLGSNQLLDLTSHNLQSYIHTEVDAAVDAAQKAAQAWVSAVSTCSS